MRRVTEWLEQVVGGLSDGKDWVVRKLKSLPTPVRYGGWFVAQAFLFKIQPWLWYVLLDVVGFVTGALELRLKVQLLVAVLAFLTIQTVLAENRFKRLRKIVKDMDDSTMSENVTAADGGSEIGLREPRDDWNSARVYAFCGAVGGGALGVPWGPAGVIGLAILGAMIGYDLERHTFGE